MDPSALELAQLRGDALQFCKQVEQFARDSISRQQATQDDSARIAMIAMAVRMFKSHQAVRQLVTSELNDAAAAVLRSMLEQYFLLRAVVENPDVLKLAAEEAEVERRKALRGLEELSPDERGDEITDDAIAAALAGIEAKRTYNAYEWAKATGLVGFHNTIWRSLCSYAHGSLVAIERYVKIAPDGTVQGITAVVEPVASIDYAITACWLLLDTVKAIDKAPGSEVSRARYQILRVNFEGLQGRYWAIARPNFDAGR